MLRIWTVVAVLLVWPAGRSAARAQSPGLPPALKAAQALFQEQKWPEAVAAYEAIVATDRDDPRPRAGLAAALYAIGQFEKALPIALETNRLLADPATQLSYPGLPVGAVMVRIARIHNRLGHLDEAFEWLTKAASYPIPNPASLETEADMANLRADARWQAFSKTVATNMNPCAHRPEFRQFDFWVGDWDVMGASGQKVGTSRIELTLNGCVILETYTGAPGTSLMPNYVGQSFSFFDAKSNGWVQHYVDTTGAPADWKGEFVNGVMRFTREGPFGPSNATVKRRMTFTSRPDGSVRQLFEQSLDDGKTWRAGFDGIYVKRAGEGREK